MRLVFPRQSHSSVKCFDEPNKLFQPEPKAMQPEVQGYFTEGSLYKFFLFTALNSVLLLVSVF